MKIAIVGGGMTAMAAAIYLKKEMNIEPTIFDFGWSGQFKKGGLKFIHSSWHTRKFISSLIGIRYSTQKINGGVYYDGNVHEFPSFVRQCDYNLGLSIQELYWNKTRDGEFDDRCMGDPWHTSFNLALEPSGGKFELHKIMEQMTEELTYGLNVSSENLKIIIKSHDIVIYTAKIDMLLEAIGLQDKYKMISEPLNIFRVKLNELASNHIWWDYSYIPDSLIMSHRMSTVEKGIYDFEVNEKNMPPSIESESVEENIKYFVENKLGFENSVINLKHIILSDGHISNDMGDDVKAEIPKNIIPLGRYAECDKRIMFNNVLETIYSWNAENFNDRLNTKWIKNI